MWATLKPLTNQSRRRGFTIVELLIVIVVIGILAAIVIVAYNGITARANQASAQSAAEQAAKKVLAYMVLNADQVPPDLAAAGVMNGYFQYSSNSSTNPQTFCITATTANVSYYVDNGSHTTPTAGACAGHGTNGVAPITNLVNNPELANDTSGWNLPSSSNGSPVGSRITGLSIPGLPGVTTAYRVTLGGTPSSWYRTQWGPAAVTSGQTYTLNGWVRTSQNVSVFPLVQWSDISHSGLPQSLNSGTTVTANTWTPISLTATAPANAAWATVQFGPPSGGYAGATLDTTGVIFTVGSTVYNFADGNTAGWVWNGTANASTSTGSPL